MTADLTLRGPGDVVAVLPYQLGYHPHDSVVVVSLRHRRIGLVARCDLPPPAQVGTVVESLLGPLVRDRGTSVILVGYEEVADTSQPVLLALVEAIEREGLDVADVVVVRNGRRYSATCSDPCCPPDGVPLDDPADVPAVAEYVVLGRFPLDSRTAVGGLVEPDPGRCAGVAEAVAARAGMPRRRRRSVAAWAQVLARGGGGPARLDPTTVADVALGLADVPWRDGLIAWLAPSVLRPGDVHRTVAAALESGLPRWGGMGPRVRRQELRVVEAADPPERQGAGARTEAALRAERVVRAGLAERELESLRAEHGALVAEREELLQRLLDLCRSVPDQCAAEAAVVCTVAAHVAWVAGDGAVARVAVERALRLAPGYRLAQLLLGLVDAGVRLPPVNGAAGRQGLDRAG